jgi:hypothetical protein
VKKHLKVTFAAVLLSAAVSVSAIPAAFADEAAAAGGQTSITAYDLNESLKVEVKSVLNERVAGGTRLGAVVRLTNTSGKLTRVPDYELRLKTADGIEYTLQPSASNAPSVNAKSSRELSYLLTIDNTDDVKLSGIEWVDVDYYVYPKKETVKLELPVDGLAWQGADAAVAGASALKKWGESFTIPALDSPLVYKPVSITRDFSGTQPVSVVQMLVENPGNARETLPALAMDGKTATDVYSGKLVEEGAVVLEAGEKRYIHFAIPTDIDSELTSLNVLTVENYKSAAEGDKTFNVGRLNILLPTASAASSATAGEASYKLGDPIGLDKLNKIVHPNMEVSLVELHLQENDGDGFKTAVAKFKLVNKSDRPLPVPSFQTELISSDGYVYAGYAQDTVAPRVLPGAAYAVSYSFTVPKSETSDTLKLNLLDAQTIKPYKSVIASIDAGIQTEDTNRNFELNLYPLTVKITDWSIGANYSPAAGYSYKTKLFLDIKQDQQAIVDATSPKLQLEYVDSSGKTIGSSGLLGFAGTNKLMNGENDITVNAVTEQMEIPLTVRIYETFVNANGEQVKRLLTTFKQ